MERLALIAGLKPGAQPAATALIAEGPPFDPEQSGFQRHSVYLSADEVVFVFEAHEVEWLVDALVDNPFHWMLSEAMEQWRPLLAEPPRIARERFFWEHSPQTGRET